MNNTFYIETGAAVDLQQTNGLLHFLLFALPERDGELQLELLLIGMSVHLRHKSNERDDIMRSSY